MTRIVYHECTSQQERQTACGEIHDVFSQQNILDLKSASYVHSAMTHMLIITFGGVLLYIAEFGAAEVARSLIHYPSLEQENLVSRGRARKHHGGFI